MYKLPFVLKQHTPIIHFQYDQDDALIRATEVKPKLDRFLWVLIGKKYENKWEVIFELFCQWLSGYSKKNHQTHKKEFLDGQRIALNYSLRFIPGPVEKILIPISNNRPETKQPFFFGNMGDGYEHDKKSYHYTVSDIRMEVLVKNTLEIDHISLKKLIESSISQFFFSHNFGTRQSKGFGSFYPSPSSKGYIAPEDIVTESGNKPFSYTVTVQGNNFLEKSKRCLSDMEVVYKALRSGINTTSFRNPGIYLKSILWTYFKNVVNNNIKWEKKKTKEVFFGPNQGRHFTKHSEDPGFSNSPLGSKDKDEIAIKDLFGLSSVESWGAEYSATITKEIDGIDRFQSPVFFKPILTGGNSYRIYFDASELTEQNSVLNKTILIKNGTNSFAIKTPESFDFYDFFNYLLQTYSLERNLVFKLNSELSLAADLDNEEKRGVPEYRVLKNFFNTLR